MADTYAKLFGSILDSSVWQESKETRLVWITLLAMKDRYGVVNAAIPGLADRAKVTRQECVDALAILSSPDEWSRSKEHEGRRIKEIAGGWQVLNHAIYRDRMNLDERREYQRVKQTEYRKRRKDAVGFGKQEGAQEAIADGFRKASQRNEQ